MDVTDLLDVRVVLVTGKGGVGKSAVAGALALAAARTGRRACLVEVEGRQTFARLFDTPEWDFEEREFRPGVHGLSVDPEASLAEYLERFYGARRISRLVVGSSAVEFATTAAPGLKDVLLIGKIRELERRRDEDGRFHYDLVVVDAPPTGRITGFLRAPDATTELVNVGPIRAQAQSLIDLVLDERRTRALLVTLYEEMPVAEAVESVHALRDLGVAVGPIVVNRVLPARFDEAQRKALATQLDAGRLVELFRDADLEVDAGTAEALLARGRDELDRLALQQAMREELEQRVALPRLELPELFADEFGSGQLGRLADCFEAVWQ